jgi:hypothetical protein
MAIAPLEYVVIRVQDDQFRRDILPALTRMQQAGSVRVVDLLFVAKDELGTVVTSEVRELDGDDLQPFSQLVGDLQGLLTADDIATLTEDLPVTASAAIVLLEHLWVQELRKAVAQAGAMLSTAGLVSPDALARVNEEWAALAVH